MTRAKRRTSSAACRQFMAAYQNLEHILFYYNIDLCGESLMHHIAIRQTSGSWFHLLSRKSGSHSAAMESATTSGR